MTYADGDAGSVGSAAAQRNGRSIGVEVAELTHHEVRAKLSELLDDTLDETARAGLARHLAACPSCTAYLRTLRRTVDLLGTLPVRRMPERLSARLRDIASEEPVA